jgi:hypothetical protein
MLHIITFLGIKSDFDLLWERKKLIAPWYSSVCELNNIFFLLDRKRIFIVFIDLRLRLSSFFYFIFYLLTI